MSSRFSSARHQAALGTPTSYRRFSRFTVSRGGVSLELEPVSGSLTQDTRRNSRWDGRLSFAGADLIPRSPRDLLTPFGTQVRVELGLELLDGSVSTVPYGVYDIASSRTRLDAGTRVVDVSLVDLSDRVERYQFEAPKVITASTDIATMVNAVILNRTGSNPNIPTAGQTVGEKRIMGLETGTGPWKELQDILVGYSRTLVYSRVGQLQMITTTTDPNAAYPLDMVSSLSADFDTRPPNVIVARGETPDGATPVHAVVVDSDPSSPTYAGTGPGGSPYGRSTAYYTNSALNWNYPGLALLIATAIMQQRAGAGATYNLVRSYDPTISAGDVVSHDGQILAVDAVTMDLAGDTTLQVREL